MPKRRRLPQRAHRRPLAARYTSLSTSTSPYTCRAMAFYLFERQRHARRRVSSAITCRLFGAGWLPCHQNIRNVLRYLRHGVCGIEGNCPERRYSAQQRYRCLSGREYSLPPRCHHACLVTIVSRHAATRARRFRCARACSTCRLPR